MREMLPTISLPSNKAPELSLCNEGDATRTSKNATEPQNVWNYVPESINQNSGISPSLLWGILTTFILLACVLHIAGLWAADLWSPLTRDLALEHNDLPHRRSVYLNIGTSVLVAMAFVISFPLIVVGRFFPLASTGHVLAWVTILTACAAGLLRCRRRGAIFITRSVPSTRSSTCWLLSLLQSPLSSGLGYARAAISMATIAMLASTSAIAVCAR